MDMLKKARVKAKAAVKEVQTIIQAPPTQQQSYVQSPHQQQLYQQNQYYPQQYPPPAQQFQPHQQPPQQYSPSPQTPYPPPSQPFQQAQPQHQYSPANQYPQYSSPPQIHQPQPVQPFQRPQYPLPPQAQQPPLEQQQSQQPQYSLPPQVQQPQYSSPPQSHQAQSVQQFQRPQYPLPPQAQQQPLEQQQAPKPQYAPLPQAPQSYLEQQVQHPQYSPPPQAHQAQEPQYPPPPYAPQQSLEQQQVQRPQYSPLSQTQQRPLEQQVQHPQYSPPPQAHQAQQPPPQQQTQQPQYAPLPQAPQSAQPSLEQQVQQPQYSPPPQAHQAQQPPPQQQTQQQQYNPPSQVPQAPQPSLEQQVQRPQYSPPPQTPQPSLDQQVQRPQHSPPPQAPQPSLDQQVQRPQHSPPPQAPQPSLEQQVQRPQHSPPPQAPQPSLGQQVQRPQHSPPPQAPQPSLDQQVQRPQYSPPPQAPQPSLEQQVQRPQYSPPPQAPQPSLDQQVQRPQHSPPPQTPQPSLEQQVQQPQYSPPPQAQQPPPQQQTQQPHFSPQTHHRPLEQQFHHPQQSPVQTPLSQYPPPLPPPPKPQIPLPTSYSYGHPPPQELPADPIPIKSQSPQHQPSFQNTAPGSAVIPQRQAKCSGFDGVLTDKVQFFELKSSVANSHNVPASSVGELAICEYCFYSIIAPYPWLASCFDPRPKGARPEDKSLPQINYEKVIGCGLAFPSIRQVLIGQTIPQNSIQPFIEFARLDAEIPACSGKPSTGGYYGTDAATSLALCRSCFECYIRRTSFEMHFSLRYMPQADQQWICGVGYTGYIQRTLLADLAKQPQDFSHFALEANKRLAIPPCTGENQPIALAGAASSSVFRSVKDNCGVFCSGCFHDYVAGTPAEKDFGFEIELDDSQKSTLSCDLTSDFSKFAMKQAVRACKFDVWHGPIVARANIPLCPSIAGSDEADFMVASLPPVWYCFTDYPQIEVCPRCYGITVCVLQATELFSPITRPPKPGVIRICYLSPAKDLNCLSYDPMDYENTTAWRGQYLRNVIAYGRDSGGDFTVAKQVAKTIASLPPPCGSELRKFKQGSGRKWLGHQATNPNDANDCTLIICDECHLYSVKGTPLESFLSNDLTSITFLEPEGHRCSTWSKQCKRRLRTACETQDFATYAQWHHKREDTYNRLCDSINQLKPLMEMLKEETAKANEQAALNVRMGSLRLMQQMNTQTNAMMMGVGGSFAEAAASDTGYRYGNSTVGMGYLTSAGAQAAQAQHNAANLPAVNFQGGWQGGTLDQLTAEVKRRLEIHDAIKAEWAVID